MVIPPRMIDVMKQKGLKPMARFIYHNLATRADQHGRCYVSAKRLADDIGITVQRMRPYVTELISAGLVNRKVGGGRKRATEYTVLVPPNRVLKKALNWLKANPRKRKKDLNRQRQV